MKAEREIRELIGDESYLKLVEYFGGDTTYIPVNVEGTILEQVVGFEAAQILSERYSPDYLAVPLSKAFRAKIYHRRTGSVVETARMLCMTRQGTQRLLKRP